MHPEQHLLSEERRRLILEWVHRDGNVSTGVLLKRLEVSPMTLWRDLAWLEENQLIKRTRGGALAFNHTLGGSEKTPPRLKADRDRRCDAVAREAARRIEHSRSLVFLKDGPLVRRLPELLSNPGLRVTADSLPLLTQLSREHPRLAVTILPGELEGGDLPYVAEDGLAWLHRMGPVLVVEEVPQPALKNGHARRNGQSHAKEAVRSRTRPQRLWLAEQKHVEAAVQNGWHPSGPGPLLCDSILSSGTVHALQECGVEPVVVSVDETALKP